MATRANTFIDGTLWTDYTLAGEPDPRAETDGQIDIEHDGGSHLITIGDSIRLHREAARTLETLIAASGDKPVVMVTHYAPVSSLPSERHARHMAGR